MMEVVVVLVLTLHLLCVNVSTGGPLVCIWLEWREGRGDTLAGRVGRYLANVSLGLFVAGMLLGILLGLLLWTASFQSGLIYLWPRIKYGLWELLFSLVLMAWHAAWWRLYPRCSAAKRAVRVLLPLAAGTNLLYHFPPLFVILAQVSAAGVGHDAVVTSAEFRRLMADGAVLARVVHFSLASLAMTGITMFGYALRAFRRNLPEDDAKRPAIWGGRLALIATLLQIPVGMWILVTIPADRQIRLLGGDWIATCLLVTALLAAFWLLHQLAALALGDVRRGVMVRAMLAMTVIVVLMTATLRRDQRAPAAREKIELEFSRQ